MTRPQFYLLLDELLQNPPGTIRGGERLGSFPKWDSVAIIGFIVLLDREFGVAVPATKITGAQTVADLTALVDSQLH